MDLARIDLNLLVALDALLSERSVTRAAERLGVGQSATSATLARLRRLLDDPLLVRQGRRMTTTPLADSLVDPVREALSIIEQTLGGRSSFDPATDHRSFTVVTSDYVTLVFLRPLLARLATEAPHVHLRLRPLAEDSLDQLRRGRVDLLIRPAEVLDSHEDLPSAPLFTDRYVAVVGGDHPDVGDALSLDQLSSLPYLAYAAGPLRSLADRRLDAAGVPRNVEVTTETFLLAPYLLPGTRMVTLLQERLARLVAKHLDLRLLEPPLPLDPITEVLAWSPRHDHDPAHAWLRGRLRDLASLTSAGGS